MAERTEPEVLRDNAREQSVENCPVCFAERAYQRAIAAAWEGAWRAWGHGSSKTESDHGEE